ncbi:hypothetical protein ACQP1G_36380 [Nocardia sp. CA-107356]|uniref:hypothetical protein n=1 Tax=Nocardia sp. CA-107356 TaxID=3239972 RepID=UPI003D8BC4FB
MPPPPQQSTTPDRPRVDPTTAPQNPPPDNPPPPDTPQPPDNPQPSNKSPEVAVPSVRPVEPTQIAPSTTSAVPLPPVAAQPAGLELTPSAIGLGDDVTAAGSGCDPQAQVSLLVGETPVGSTVAGADGVFRSPLALTSIEVGRYQVTARCGRTLSAPLDVVLVSRISAATSTLTVILFFLLIGGWFYGHRLVSHLPERSGP